MDEEAYKSEIFRLERMLYVIVTSNAHNLQDPDKQHLEIVKARQKVREAETTLQGAKLQLEKLEAAKKPKYPLLAKWVGEIEISTRPSKVITKAFGPDATILDLARKSETEMLELENFGRKSLNELKELLSSRGLHFGMTRESAEKMYKPT